MIAARSSSCRSAMLARLGQLHGVRTYASGPSLRPLHATLPHRNRYPYREPELAVDHLVIGGGVVGLAIGAALCRRWPGKTTYVVERHGRAGEETSSRNSEVIHAGLYYPADSLKTRFCLQGRELMYKRCEEWQVPHKQTGKLVVGDESQRPYLEKVYAHCESLGSLKPPTRIISGDEARKLEPDLSPDIACALLSERTGIVSSHELMESLEREILDAESAELVYSTSVVRVDPHEPSTSQNGSGKRGADPSQEGWVVQTVTSADGVPEEGAEADALLARVVINASGLNGNLVLNSLLPRMERGSEPLAMYYSKGSYASYKGPGAKNVKHLIYPCPATHGTAHNHQSLGTHLTLDLAGNIKFGPDTEWLSPPSSGEDAIDFWKRHLAPNDKRLESMYADITRYLPNISPEGLTPDYVGIRPKLAPPGGPFNDFAFLWHASRELGSQRPWQESPPDGGDVGGGAMLSLVGIESPGLTSSLAIGEHVQGLIAKRVWGDHARSKPKNEGAKNEEIGGESLAAWA